LSTLSYTVLPPCHPTTLQPYHPTTLITDHFLPTWYVPMTSFSAVFLCLWFLLLLLSFWNLVFSFFAPFRRFLAICSVPTSDFPRRLHMSKTTCQQYANIATPRLDSCWLEVEPSSSCPTVHCCAFFFLLKLLNPAQRLHFALVIWTFPCHDLAL